MLAPPVNAGWKCWIGVWVFSVGETTTNRAETRSAGHPLRDVPSKSKQIETRRASPELAGFAPAPTVLNWPVMTPAAHCLDIRHARYSTEPAVGPISHRPAQCTDRTASMQTISRIATGSITNASLRSMSTATSNRNGGGFHLPLPHASV